MKIPIRRAILNWTGRLFTFASLGFVGFLVWKNSNSLAEVDWLRIAPAMLGCVLAYAISTTLVARGWYEIVLALGETSVKWPQAWQIYGRSQLAKYLPGNVFHIAGRHMLGRSLGMKHAALAMSTIIEMGLLFASTLLLALLASRQWLVHFGSQVKIAAFIFIFLGALAALAVFIALRRKGMIAELKLAHLLHALFIYVIFFASVGLITAWLLSVQLRIDVTTVLLASIGAYAVAWTLGFVMPGSPGGLGVREAALVFMLGQFAHSANIALFAIMLRGVTILGDVLLFLAANHAARAPLSAASQSRDDTP